MATTSPDNIWTPDSGDNYALTTDLAATADTIQDALTALRSDVPIIPFTAVEATNANAGTVTSTGTPGAFTGITAPSVSVTTAAACKARITISFIYSGSAATNNAFITAVLSGATTLTPSITSTMGIRAAGISATAISWTYSGSWLVDLNPGTTTITVAGQAAGAGGTRTIQYIDLIVEPVIEAP